MRYIADKWMRLAAPAARDIELQFNPGEETRENSALRAFDRDFVQRQIGALLEDLDAERT